MASPTSPRPSADVDDGHEDGSQLGAHGAEAVTGKQCEGESGLAGDHADRDRDEAEKDVADESRVDDVLEIQSDGQRAAGHHRDDDENEARPDDRQAYVALALTLRDGGERKFAVLHGCFGLVVFLHFLDLPLSLKNTFSFLLGPPRLAAGTRRRQRLPMMRSLRLSPRGPCTDRNRTRVRHVAQKDFFMRQ